MIGKIVDFGNSIPPGCLIVGGLIVGGVLGFTCWLGGMIALGAF